VGSHTHTRSLAFIMVCAMQIVAAVAALTSGALAAECPSVLEKFANVDYTADLSAGVKSYPFLIHFCGEAGGLCQESSKLGATCGACQRITNAGSFFSKYNYYGIGMSSGQTATEDPNTGTVTVNFQKFTSNTDGKARVAKVIILCDKTAPDGKLVSFTNDAGADPGDPLVYTFTMKHAKACPGSDGPNKGALSKKGALSFGSVALIIILALVVNYFLIGFVFLKFAKQREGTDAIPQFEFWKGLPSLIMDGGRFIRSKTGAQQQSGAGYDEI